MITSNRTLRGLMSCLGLMLALAGPLRPLEVDSETRAQARKALDASAQGRHEESYKLWAALVSKGPTSLGEEVYRFARSQMYMQAYKKIEEIGEDCSTALQWVGKGKAPGPPSYDNAADAFYPMLLAAEGVCYAQREDYEQAYTQLSLAKVEFRKIPDEDMSDAIRQVDHYLSLVEGHVLSAGDYVTNKGLLQAWIGKVKGREGNMLEIEITYANKDLGAGYSNGQRTRIPVTDCKELGAISADAALKGWREE